MSDDELFNPSDYDSSRNFNSKDDPYFEEKVLHEIHRMTGFLRFTPDENGVYIARCAPDHFILPALAEHFTARFGETPWAIIDEKRGLCLTTYPTGKPNLLQFEKSPFSDKTTSDKDSGKWSDEWEELWKHYHKTINNESRKNPALQRQFMPKRYWKYLPEV